MNFQLHTNIKYGIYKVNYFVIKIPINYINDHDHIDDYLYPKI